MAVKNVEVTDIYTDKIDPDSIVNPKLIGSFWINNSTGEAWTCVDNTNNNNVWKRFFLPYKWKNLGSVSGTFNLTINGENDDYNYYYMTLTASTKFGTINFTGAAERSGILAIIGGGTYLTQFFTNAYYSFTIPISTPPTNSSNGANLYFPYYCFPDGIGNESIKVAFTRI